MVDFHVVIPARHASTRLPGKPLLNIGGKPMVVRVAEQAAQSGAQQIWIATDHQDIINAAQQYGFKACLTKANHISGTDRIAEVVTQQQWPDNTIIVNVQGDEPLIPPELISAVAEHLHQHPACAIATACHAIQDEAAMHNPNVVKVVLDKNSNALYFSRAAIPFQRDTTAQKPSTLLRHIGIYAYRAGFLRSYSQLTPCETEQLEALEQLRALHHGYKIGVVTAAHAPPGGVDTQQDLENTQQIFAAFNCKESR
jgi:3-deoxy-manno-octulosonate cytidylyltransferase (CMP-KDO synthetase)